MRVSPCRFDGSSVEPFWILDSELIAGSNSFSDASASLLETDDREIDWFGCGIVC
jgi:hypothetical protein